MSQPQPERRPTSIRRSITLIIALVLLLVSLGFTTGCSSDTKKATETAVSMTMPPGVPPMPDWLSSADPLIKAEYVYAASHLQELQYIPCYCGCGSSGHTDNFACYFKRDGAGKIVAYDQMSYG